MAAVMLPPVVEMGVPVIRFGIALVVPGLLNATVPSEGNIACAEAVPDDSSAVSALVPMASTATVSSQP